jgi:hypothetical protein
MQIRKMSSVDLEVQQRIKDSNSGLNNQFFCIQRRDNACAADQLCCTTDESRSFRHHQA